jgi:Flp pilus assembly protein TadD
MQENWAEALKLASGPEDDVLLISVAFIQQNWQDALKLAVKAAGERSLLSGAFYVLQGYAYDQMGDSSQALGCLEQAVASP